MKTVAAITVALVLALIALELYIGFEYCPVATAVC